MKRAIQEKPRTGLVATSKTRLRFYYRGKRTQVEVHLLGGTGDGWEHCQIGWPITTDKAIVASAKKAFTKMRAKHWPVREPQRRRTPSTKKGKGK